MNARIIITHNGAPVLDATTIDLVVLAKAQGQDCYNYNMGSFGLELSECSEVSYKEPNEPETPTTYNKHELHTIKYCLLKEHIRKRSKRRFDETFLDELINKVISNGLAVELDPTE